MIRKENLEMWRSSNAMRTLHKSKAPKNEPRLLVLSSIML